MQNRVQNRLFGKIVRTIGYALILLTSLILAVTAFVIFAKTIQIDGNATVTQINDIVKNLKIPNLIFYSNLAFLVGLLLVAWALGRGYVGKIIYTIIWALILIYLILGPSFAHIFLPGPQPGYLEEFVTKNGKWFTDLNHKLVEGVIGGIVTLIFSVATVVIIGGKKPARVSNKLVGSGMVFIVFFVVISNILVPALSGVEGVAEIFENKWFVAVKQALHALGFVLTAIGSLFGTIFFFNK